MFTASSRHLDPDNFPADVTDKFCWQSIPGLWVLEDEPPLLALVWRSADEEREAVLLEDFGNTPAFSLIDLNAGIPGKFIGPAKLKVEAGAALDDTPLGRLAILEGLPTMTVLSYGNIHQLRLPPDLLIKEDDEDEDEDEGGEWKQEDADYGTNWSLLLQFADYCYATVLEANRLHSWLKGWRPPLHSNGGIEPVQ